MADNYLSNPLVFLVQTLLGLYVATLLLRLILQWVRADFYNPFSQFIVKITQPVIQPLRRFVPPVFGLDSASLFAAWFFKAVEIYLILLILGAGASPLPPFLWAIPALAELTLSIFLYAIIILAIISWIQPDPYNPVQRLLISITRPVLDPFQRLIPPISGIDLSPMAAIITLYLLQMLLVPPLRMLTGMPVGL